MKTIAKMDLEEYERAMDEAIPQIIQSAKRRIGLAEDARRRILAPTGAIDTRHPGTPGKIFN